MGYSGLFLRHDLGQNPGDPSTGWSESPDILLNGEASQPDLSQFTSAAGYQNAFNATVYTNNNDNYVYIRGLNTANGAQQSRVYFYYTESDLMLWPANWRSDRVRVIETPQNYVDIAATSSNQIVVGSQPLIWNAAPLDGSQWDHYCVVAWADNSTNPQPPSIPNFGSCDELAHFIMAHPNMAWRNTVDVSSPPPDFAYGTTLSMASGGGTVYLQVNFINVPGDGTFSVNVQGPDPQNSISLQNAKVSDYQGGYMPRSPLVFPANFSTGVSVQHWPGQTPLPASAKIVVLPLIQQGPPLEAFHEAVNVPRGIASPFFTTKSRDEQGYEVAVQVMAIGSQSFNLKFDSSKLFK
jgi:hypothetical protein